MQRKLALPNSDQQRNYATGKSPIVKMDKRSRKAKSKATERQEEPVDGATHDVERSVSPQKGGVTPTPDWLLTFLAHQEDRDAKREERHEATMHMLCETFSRRSINV